ncbi:MAG: calcium/sodium antiporter [Gemmatimonadaceae bacterium]|nr:calcium/sodium antiporter [Gemmatimonadaceae bacterium]
MTIVHFLLGLVLLVVGAELLVRGASRLALSFGISPLVVGLTVVAFGTSAPELAVSVQSAYSGQADIAMGNVVGSNILNVLFILGLSALIVPLIVNVQLVRQEVPIMIGVSLLLFVLSLDGTVSRGDGALFLVLLTGYTVFLIRQSRSAGRAAAPARPAETGEPPSSAWDRHWSVQLALIIVGLLLLVQGSNWLVDAAVTVARHLGVSELVVGLTIVAAGTSLPEVATSVMASIRGERDIAVGNIVGSNIFNILAVLGVSSVLAPHGLRVSPAMLHFDMWVMIAAALACLPVFFSGYLIARWEGAMFLAYYVAYTAYLILASTQHDALPNVRLAMVAVVMPMTVITLAVVSARAWRQQPR